MAKNNCGNSTSGPVWSFTTGSAPIYTPSQDQQALLDQYGAPDYLSISFGSTAPMRQETWAYVDLQKTYLFRDGVSLPATSLTVDPKAYADPPYLDPAMFTKDTTLSDIADYLQSNYTTVDTSVLQPLIGNSDFKAYEFKDAGLYVALVDGSLTAVQTIDIPKTPPSPAAMPSYSGEQSNSSGTLPAAASPDETALALMTLGIFIYMANGYDPREDPNYDEYIRCKSSSSNSYPYYGCSTDAAIALFVNALLSIPDKRPGLQSAAQQAQTITNNTGTSTGPCTGFNYSDWRACASDGKQTRTVTGYIPPGCTEFPPNPPDAIRSCTPNPPCTGYTYSGWSACGSDCEQTRIVTGRTPSGCEGDLLIPL